MLSDPPNERNTEPEPNVGTVLYQISLGVVAIATVVVFFGPAFFLLAHSDEELIADARDRGVEVAPQHADLVSPPNKDAAPFPAQTAPAPSGPAGDPPFGRFRRTALHCYLYRLAAANRDRTWSVDRQYGNQGGNWLSM